MSERAMDMATLMGGVELQVKLKSGTSQAVWVRQLEIEDYPELLKRLEDERGQIELYCRERAGEVTGEAAASVSTPPPWVPVRAGWAKLLSVEGHDLVMETAEGLNRDFFGHWLQRRFRKLEAIRPGLVDELRKGAVPPSSGLPEPGVSLGHGSPRSRSNAG